MPRNSSFKIDFLSATATVADKMKLTQNSAQVDLSSMSLFTSATYTNVSVAQLRPVVSATVAEPSTFNMQVL